MSLIISGGLFLKTIQELTLPTLAGNTGKYLRVASGEATLEWATVGGGTASAITVASEAVDQTCFPLFTTAATGDLSVYSNPELTFNSSLAVLGSRVLQSTATTGTPPMVIASTTKVVNLNADLLDGFNSSDFLGVSSATHTVTSMTYTRIAQSSVDIGTCVGTFKIKHTSSIGYGEVLFHASIQASTGSVSSSAVSISQIGGFSTFGLIIRVVYHTTATGNYAYLEVYNSPPATMTLDIEMIDGTGWTLNSSYTAGSVPVGYTSQSITAGRGLVSIFDITANNQLKSTVATGTAPLAVTSTTVVTNLNSDYLDNEHGSYYLDCANFTGTLPGDRGVSAGSTSSSFVEYNGTTKAAGQFFGGTDVPTSTNRLNYDGYFYPTFLNLSASGDTTNAATHYFCETGDGFVRPKTVANVRTDILGPSGSVSWDVPSLAGHTSASTSLTVTGAVVGDYVLLSTSGTLTSDLYVQGVVTSANTVTIYVFNTGVTTRDPSSQTWYVRVLKR